VELRVIHREPPRGRDIGVGRQDHDRPVGHPAKFLESAPKVMPVVNCEHGESSVEGAIDERQALRRREHGGHQGRRTLRGHHR
jgi:hypothetical protein